MAIAIDGMKTQRRRPTSMTRAGAASPRARKIFGGSRRSTEGRGIAEMTEPKNTEAAVSKFDDKLHKLIKRAKKQRGLLWTAVLSKLELARADVKAMIKVYDSGPK